MLEKKSKSDLKYFYCFWHSSFQDVYLNSQSASFACFSISCSLSCEMWMPSMCIKYHSDIFQVSIPSRSVFKRTEKYSLLFFVLYISYLCLICVQSCTFPFLFYHGTFHYFHLAQMSKNLFLFKFVFYRTGDFSGLIMDDIWNHWENSGEFHRFCNLQFQVLAYLLQVLSSMFVCNY